MRWDAKTDINQADIIRAFELAGASVEPLHRHGQGLPDLLVAFDKLTTFLVEVKRNEKSKLTPPQIAFQLRWKGRMERVETVQQVMGLVAYHNRITARRKHAGN